MAAAVSAMTAESEARLARAMATTMIDEDGGEDFAESDGQARLAAGAGLGTRPWTTDADFETSPIRQSDELTLALDGWEGPLDLLLSLARDAEGRPGANLDPPAGRAISCLSRRGARAEARDRRRLSGDGGVAGLPQILPAAAQGPGADPSPEEIALRLQLRLQRLDAMREAGARLLGRDRVGRDVFVRGSPEGLRLVRKSAWQARDFDLFAAYGAVRARTAPAMHVVHARSVMTLDEAIERVGRMIGAALDWTSLETFLPVTQDPQFRRSALASSFVAALELARRGRLDLDQDEPFAPIRLRAA